MNVLLINGSPHKEGCTYTALREVADTLEAEGIKVCKDKLYLGYTARGITADNTKHYQNIFVFDPSSK